MYKRQDVPFPVGIHFWDVFDPGFGIIGPFLSAFLLFIGAAVFRRYSNRREELIPPKMDLYDKKEPSTEPLQGFNYCPECGSKIVSNTQQFCMSCGLKLQNL